LGKPLRNAPNAKDDYQVQCSDLIRFRLKDALQGFARFKLHISKDEHALLTLAFQENTNMRTPRCPYHYGKKMVEIGTIRKPAWQKSKIIAIRFRCPVAGCPACQVKEVS
jgi:hypothetical protein